MVVLVAVCTKGVISTLCKGKYMIGLLSPREYIGAVMPMREPFPSI